MEYVLLGNAGIRAERLGVKLAVKVVVIADGEHLHQLTDHRDICHRLSVSNAGIGQHHHHQKHKQLAKKRKQLLSLLQAIY